MKRLLSLCLAALLLFGMMPMTTLAMETENLSLQELKEQVKNNSIAVIRDADGNVLDTMEVDVQVQQIRTNRSSDGIEYSITCAARAKDNDEYSDSDTRDGYIAILTMVCKDVFGTENQLISVTTSFGSKNEDTDSRKVTYTSYDFYNNKISTITENPPDWAYTYTPVDFTGFTFRASASARIKKTGHSFDLYVTTDSI